MHSFSFRLVAAICTFLAVLKSARATPYSLIENYQGDTILSGFDFFNASDPSGGWVTYVDKATAVAQEYIVVSSGVAYIGVDHTTVLNSGGAGRSAVRLTSAASYNQGLFIADFEHMPGGICGIWPAFWMVGTDWPSNGEMDIVEGVNLNTQNIMTAHTSSNCSTNGQNQFATLLRGDCNDGDGPSDPDLGCSSQSPNTNSFGQNFNDVAGGAFAFWWTSETLQIHYFQRGTIPSDILNDEPDPTTWGKAGMVISCQECDIDTHFANMQLVLDTDFCGGWAESVWNSSGCNTYADTCVDYVANNPSAFSNAYWAVNYIKVFQLPPGAVLEGIPVATRTKTFTPLAAVSSVGLAGLAMGAPSDKVNAFPQATESLIPIQGQSSSSWTVW